MPLDPKFFHIPLFQNGTKLRLQQLVQLDAVIQVAQIRKGAAETALHRTRNSMCGGNTLIS